MYAASINATGTTVALSAPPRARVRPWSTALARASSRPRNAPPVCGTAVPARAHSRGSRFARRQVEPSAAVRLRHRDPATSWASWRRDGPCKIRGGRPPLRRRYLRLVQWPRVLKKASSPAASPLAHLLKRRDSRPIRVGRPYSRPYNDARLAGPWTVRHVIWGEQDRLRAHWPPPNGRSSTIFGRESSALLRGHSWSAPCCGWRRLLGT